MEKLRVQEGILLVLSGQCVPTLACAIRDVVDTASKLCLLVRIDASIHGLSEVAGLGATFHCKCVDYDVDVTAKASAVGCSTMGSRLFS